ncbi:flagellar basal body-associated protein FliL [Buttiauxella warmboldiae]|uniref:Flagellar protein FliL n=1 Tax=Buttiauxella warmboldiae TaxID=82993 RepID=A0A3N5DCP7_9ENTR|nr:flagellar basal body-associated protein FliL [Buttiauxella warmboldiae]RPH26524.1 flagellar basal body-associated protein FliL [Buttiauxella warmboldiae]
MSKNKQKVSAGGKKFPLVIIISLLISIIACAFGGYAFYEIKKVKTGGQNKVKPVEAVAVTVTPIYVPMETFTVSLTPTEPDSDHVLYIGLTFRVKDEASKLVLDKFLPEVRSRVFILLAHQTADDISNDEGKTKLLEKIKAVVSKPLAPHNSVVVTDVLFNAFILR